MTLPVAEALSLRGCNNGIDRHTILVNTCCTGGRLRDFAIFVVNLRCTFVDYNISKHKRIHE